MAFNAYDKRTFAQYTPLSMQEVLLPAQLQREREDKIMEQYMATESELNKMSYLVEKENDDSVMKQQFNNYKQQLQQASSDLLERGVDNSSMRKMMQFRADFPLVSAPIIKAYEAKEATAKASFAIRAKDPTAIVEDVSQLSLEDFRNNNYQPFVPKSVSVDSVAQEVSKIATNLKSVLFEEDSKGDFILKNALNGQDLEMVRAYYQRYGYDIENLKNDPEEILQDIKDRVFKRYGVKDSDGNIANYIDKEGASKLEGAAEGALFSALGTIHVQKTNNPALGFFGNQREGRVRKDEGDNTVSTQAVTSEEVKLDLSKEIDYTDFNQIGKEASKTINFNPSEDSIIYKVNKGTEELNEAEINTIIGMASTIDNNNLKSAISDYNFAKKASQYTETEEYKNANSSQKAYMHQAYGYSKSISTTKRNLIKAFKDSLKSIRYQDNIAGEVASAMGMKEDTINNLYNIEYQPTKDNSGNIINNYKNVSMQMYPIGSLKSSDGISSAGQFSLSKAKKINSNGQLEKSSEKVTEDKFSNKNVYYLNGRYVMISDDNELYALSADNNKQVHFMTLNKNVYQNNPHSVKNILSNSKKGYNKDISITKGNNNEFNFNVNGVPYTFDYRTFSSLATGKDINGNPVDTEQIATNFIQTLYDKGANLNRFLINKVDKNNNTQAFQMVIPVHKGDKGNLDASKENGNNHFITIKGNAVYDSNGRITFDVISTSTLQSHFDRKVRAFDFNNNFNTKISEALRHAYGIPTAKQVESIEKL